MTGRMLNQLSQIGILLCLAAGIAAAQPKSPPAPTPRPVPKSKIEPKEKAEAPEKVKPPSFPAPVGRDRFERNTTEKVMAVDANVTVKLCVSEGAVKINGTESKEVRVFVRNGRKFEFKALEKNPETEKANWVWITSVIAEGVRGRVSNCLAGDSVEIDMPIGGSVNLEARTSGAEVDSIKKATVKIVEGSISLRNIPNGVNAYAHQGDLTVESSSGAIDLETTTGNVLAYDVKPGQVGDLLKIRTNSGNIALQNVSHRQIEGSSVRGSLSFNGGFLTGGIYKFKTSSGSILLLLPDDTACKLVATYGFGEFKSALPMQVITQTESSGGKSFVAKIGKTDASTVYVTTSGGEIRLTKRNAKN